MERGRNRPHSERGLVARKALRHIGLIGTITIILAAIKAQEEKGRFETTVCGPKTVAYLMKEFPRTFGNQPAKDYKELSKLFGTGKSGTSLEELHDGLKKLGVETFALELNRKDFGHIKFPAILDHDEKQLTVYDIPEMT